MSSSTRGAIDQGKKARAHIAHVGKEGIPVLVVDGLLQDPEPLIHQAYAAEYQAPKSKNFPGVRSPSPKPYVRMLAQQLIGLICQAFHLPGWRLESATSDFSLITQAPSTLSVRQRVPHTDGQQNGLLAILHYLTPGDCFGTSFYRHRSTGFEQITSERKAAYEATLMPELLLIPPEGYTSGSGALFEKTNGFEGVFNRMIIYPGNALHSGDVPATFSFDTSPRLGRLTVNTFFQMRQPN